MQRKSDGTKRDLRPGYRLFVQQGDLQRFLARGEFRGRQSCAVNHVYLADVRHGNQREHAVEFDACIGLLARFPQRRLGHGFAVLHEPGRKCPKSVARFNGPSAKQDAVLPDGQSTDYQARVAVVNGTAGVADVAWQAVAGGQAKYDRGATRTAIIDGRVHGAAILAPSLHSTGAATGKEKRVNYAEYK